MKTIYTLISAVLLTLTTSAALASDLRPMDRFIYESTIMVVRCHADESFLKVFDFFAEKLLPAEDTKAKKITAHEKTMAGAIIRMLQDAGLRDAYMMVTLRGGFGTNKDEYVYFVLHVKPDTDEKVLLDFFKKANLIPPKARVKRIDEEYLFVGAEAIAEDLQSQKPVAHPELWEAFDSVDGSFVKVVIAPLDSSRRVIEEMMPTLPEEIGGGPSSILTDGVRSVAIGFSTSPELGLEIKIRAKDNAAAKAFHDWGIDKLQMLADRGIKPKEFADFVTGITKLYQPTIVGNQICFEMTENNGQLVNLAKLLKPAVLAAREADRRAATFNRFKEFGIAMQGYEIAHKKFPAAISRDKDGKPLLSWRVHLLPYVDQEKLYKQFHLDEPWDSPHNKKLISKMPKIYRHPCSNQQKPGMTNFVVVTGPDTIFPADKAIAIKEITDGMSGTIIMVEASNDAAVIWTKPDDIELDPKHPKKHLGGLRPNDSFIYLHADGSVKIISLKNISDEELLNLFLRNDGK